MVERQREPEADHRAGDRQRQVGDEIERTAAECARPRDEVGDQHAEDGGDDRGRHAQADRVDQGVARARQHRREMPQREGVVDAEEPGRRAREHGRVLHQDDERHAAADDERRCPDGRVAHLRMAHRAAAADRRVCRARREMLLEEEEQHRGNQQDDRERRALGNVVLPDDGEVDLRRQDRKVAAQQQRIAEIGERVAEEQHAGAGETRHEQRQAHRGQAPCPGARPSCRRLLRAKRRGRERG